VRGDADVDVAASFTAPGVVEDVEETCWSCPRSLSIVGTSGCLDLDS